MKSVLSLLIMFLVLGSCQNTEQMNDAETITVSKIDSTSKVDSTQLLVEALKCNITCPKCGTTSEEVMPTEVCQLAYTCKNCKTIMHPKDGDCCVFCTYGDKKCPSMQ